MVKTREQGISLAIKFDEVANGKGIRTDDFFLSHNKFALLARLRNGSRNIFVCALCWVRPASQPSFLSSSQEGLVSFFLARTRLFISCFFTCNVSQSLPVHIRTFATRQQRSVPAEGGSILETTVPFFRSSKSCKKPNVGCTRTKATFESRSSSRSGNWPQRSSISLDTD